MSNFVKSTLDQMLGISPVDAHCDIPCKIYDPSMFIIPALSIVRLIDIMEEKAAGQNPSGLGYDNTIARCVLRKEEEAGTVKEQVRVIWGDYFKAPQIEKCPNVHALVHSIMMKASACKQEVHRQDALDLVELVNQFAEMFWDTKGVKTERKTCPYPPGLDVVYPVL